jgi:predicted DNA-binding transcriptional regulator AlpA
MPEQVTCERGAPSHLTKLKKKTGIEVFCRPSVPSILFWIPQSPTTNSVFATERMAQEGIKFFESEGTVMRCNYKDLTRQNRRPIIEPRGLSRTEAAEYIGISPSLFDEMVKDGRMPSPIRINSRTVWDRKQLDEAFEALKDQPEENPWDEDNDH